MVSFDEILGEILLRKSTTVAKITNGKEGMAVSAAQLSRIKTGKASLSSKVINAIGKYLDKDDTESGKLFAKEIRKKLSDLKLNSANGSSDNRSEGHSIADAEKLFDLMAGPGSLMCTDYRDMPQLARAGAYPTLSVKIANAMNEGLCIGLFQPFGTLEALREMQNKINSLPSYPDLTLVQKGYMFLTELADNVRKVYQRIKDNTPKEMAGQVVLYEAQIETPLITSIGMQSRVLLTSYIKNEQRHEQIYEWVAGTSAQYFVERSQISLSLDALKLQFYPVYNYWEDNKERLPEGNELEDYYKKLEKEKGVGKSKALTNLLGKNMVKWKCYQP